ncbi:hypothetical protein QQP08_016850 [Theobroma cacao]|nr:hypothetical protein QQP08_016850 [Theobroma cacao]
MKEHTNMAVKSAIFIFSPFICTLAFMSAREIEREGELGMHRPLCFEVKSNPDEAMWEDPLALFGYLCTCKGAFEDR